MTTTKLPIWFWILAVVFLLWNLMGVSAFLTEMFAPDLMYAELNEAQLDYVSQDPWWSKILYGGSTIGGFLAALGLILKRKWALPLALLSLICVVFHQGHMVFMTNAGELFSSFEVYYFPAMILVGSLLLYFMIKSSISKGWLR